MKLTTVSVTFGNEIKICHFLKMSIQPHGIDRRSLQTENLAVGVQETGPEGGYDCFKVVP